MNFPRLKALRIFESVLKHKTKELSVKFGKKEPELGTKFIKFTHNPRARDIQPSLRDGIQIKGYF